MAARRKTRERAKPHSRKKTAAADRAALTPEELWARAIREAVLGDCHPWQRDAVLDPSSRISLLVGRGGGKTTVMRARAVLKMISIPDAEIIYIAKSRPNAEKLNWKPLKKLIRAIG